MAVLEYRTTPAADLLYGIAPVVIAIIVDALWKLAKVAAKGAMLVAPGALVFVLYLPGVNELILLGAAAVLASVVANRHRIARAGTPLIMMVTPVVRWSAAPSSDADLSQLSFCS